MASSKPRNSKSSRILTHTAAAAPAYAAGRMARNQKPRKMRNKIRLAFTAQFSACFIICFVLSGFPSLIAMEAESLLGGVGSAANIEQVCHPLPFFFDVHAVSFFMQRHFLFMHLFTLSRLTSKTNPAPPFCASRLASSARLQCLPSCPFSPSCTNSFESHLGNLQSSLLQAFSAT